MSILHDNTFKTQLMLSSMIRLYITDCNPLTACIEDAAILYNAATTELKGFEL